MILANVLAVVIAVVFIAAGGSKALAVPRMRESAAELGYTVTAYRGIGSLELAGAAGLLLGIAITPLGVLAGAGLLAVLAGALVTHVRHHDAPAVIAPVVLLALLVIVYLAAQMASA